MWIMNRLTEEQPELESLKYRCYLEPMKTLVLVRQKHILTIRAACARLPVNEKHP